NSQAAVCTFTLTNGSADGNPITIQAQELNEIGDFAIGSQACTVYSGPRSVAITTDRPGDDPNSPFFTTSGRNYNATPSLPPRGGAFTYLWQGINVILTTSTFNGASVSFIAYSSVEYNLAASITLIEVNGAGDAVTSSRHGFVFPAPEVPTI